ncbi:MAG: DUF4329 domain-containing protein [Clostridiales bacterium]|nr:DUF4329 domain-containing protein [Clostridiales bacterium]
MSYILEKSELITSFSYTWTYFGPVTWNYQYTVKIGNKTVVYSNAEIQRIGDHYVINSAYLMRDFGLSETQATHQYDTDFFKSADDAALAWALTYYRKSNNPNDRREYGSALYSKDDGFTFTNPIIAARETPNQLKDEDIANVSEGLNRVAFIHSHPNFPPPFENEKFSGYTTIPGQGNVLMGDLKWVQDNNTTLYVVTPSGKIKEATKADGLIVNLIKEHCINKMLNGSKEAL